MVGRLVLLIALACCAPKAEEPSFEVAMPMTTESFVVADAPKTIEELRARLAKVIEHEQIAGAAISLFDRNGVIYVGGLGVRDRATHAPVDAATAFRVGSLAKVVIALGVMRLADQGKLDVDRPLREILPGFLDNPWEATTPVTLAHLLEHTAGLDDMQLNELFADDERITAEDTLAISKRSRRVRVRPGTRHEYSNYGYTVAARAIEVASGEPFDVYLRREILAPMGIVEADYQRSGSIGARIATGYMKPDQPVVYRAFAHRPSGGLIASASDLSMLAHFMLVRGKGYPRIVSEAALARIERSGTLPYPHIDAEYGLANYVDVMHPVIARGHDGGMPGFHSSIRYFPSLGVGYTLSVNSNYTFRGYFQIRALLFAYLTQGREFAPPPAAHASELPGAPYFQLPSPQNGVFGFIERALNGWRFEEHGDHLRTTRLGGGTIMLIPTRDGGFRFPGHCGSSVRFTTNAHGEPITLWGWTYLERGSETGAALRYSALGLVMALLKLAPLWALVMLVMGLFRRRRVLPSAVVLWPAVAALSTHAMSLLLDRAFFSGVIGKLHPVTVGICATTILFAVASVATLISTVRALRRPDRPDMIAMIFPIAFGLAFTGMSLWLGLNGLIGLRTWA